MGRAGFEPTKAKPTDLQSVLVDRLSISPYYHYVNNFSEYSGTLLRDSAGIYRKIFTIINHQIQKFKEHFMLNILFFYSLLSKTCFKNNEFEANSLAFSHKIAWACGGIRTPGQLITNQLLWPTELHRHIKEQPVLKTDCKCNKILNCYKSSEKRFLRGHSTALFLLFLELPAQGICR